MSLHDFFARQERVRYIQRHGARSIDTGPPNACVGCTLLIFLLGMLLLPLLFI